MTHGPYPPSSPTPFPHPSKPTPLVSATTSPTGRRALTRASSTDSRAGLSGYVTASGLSTWRRGSKSTKGSESGKRGVQIGKKGLGMGMEGTPARRKRARRPTSRVRSCSVFQGTALILRASGCNRLHEPLSSRLCRITVPAPPPLSLSRLFPIQTRRHFQAISSLSSSTLLDCHPLRGEIQGWPRAKQTFSA